MGKRRPDVPGWASLRSDESRDLMDQVDPSYKLQEAHEGNVFPLPIPSVGYDIGSLLYVSRPAAGTFSPLSRGVRSVRTSGGSSTISTPMRWRRFAP